MVGSLRNTQPGGIKMSSLESLDWEAISKLTYKCAKCGRTFSGKEMALRRQLKCPYCNYKVIMKVRPPIVKRMKAE